MRANFGTGLAAVQIGIPVRVVLLQTDAKDKNRIQFIFNPQVVEIDAVKERKRNNACLCPTPPADWLSAPLQLRYATRKPRGRMKQRLFMGK